MAKTVLLVLFLIIVAFFSGRTLMLFSALFSKKKADIFSSFCAGSLAVLCVSFVSHFLTIMRSGPVADEKKLAGIIMVVLMTVSYFAFVVLTVIMGKAKGDKKKEKKTLPAGVKAIICIAALAVLAGVITVAFGLRVNTTGDETLETVRTFLKGNVMYTLDPLTGKPYAEGVPMRYKILCLPGLYSVMASAFGTAPEVILYNIMPAFWFVSGLCAMLSLSKSLFSEKENEAFKRSVFMLSVILFVFASDLSSYAQGFAVLSQMWTGPAIRIWVLIPFMLYLLFEKKYFLAILPVLCEALICRTQYGIGFCACIYAMFIICMIAVRRVKCLKAS
ncbi:MAG: hypothetical protein J6I66_05120 [Lachnospiraceae bacterium]|nr:hypothetical protein [Lachnospiraceae bacterium]